MGKSREIYKKSNNFNSSDSIPISIFQNRKYTILEAIIVYLREVRKLSFRKISALIHRDLRYTYNSYQNAKRKELITQKTIPINSPRIPLSIFSNKKLSALEVVVSYLKNKFPLSYHQIAVLLKRDDRTIWTVYQRARKKEIK